MKKMNLSPDGKYKDARLITEKAIKIIVECDDIQELCIQFKKWYVRQIDVLMVCADESVLDLLIERKRIIQKSRNEIENFIVSQ